MDFTLTDGFTSPVEMASSSFDEKLLLLPMPLLPFEMGINFDSSRDGGASGQDSGGREGEEDTFDRGWQRIKTLLQREDGVVLMATHNPYKVSRLLQYHLDAYGYWLALLISACHLTWHAPSARSTAPSSVCTLIYYGASHQRCSCSSRAVGQSKKMALSWARSLQ
jgi:hypothetical protein